MYAKYELFRKQESYRLPVWPQCRNVLSECPFWVQNDNFRI